MYPYFLFKDLVTIFAFFLALSVIVFFYPNLLGHSDNYLPADPMVTPASIVPEWYLKSNDVILKLCSMLKSLIIVKLLIIIKVIKIK